MTNFVGIFHNLIADLLAKDQLTSPKEKPFYMVSYNARIVAGDVQIDFYPYWLKPGETLPQVPLFPIDDPHIAINLESTFVEAIEGLPPRHRQKLRESLPNASYS